MAGQEDAQIAAARSELAGLYKQLERAPLLGPGRVELEIRIATLRKQIEALESNR